MDELSMKFNKMIMEEIGLEVGPKKRLYDQDTGAALQIDGKDVVAPGVFNKEAQEFDPYNSTKMMSQVFSYYTQKLSDSGEAPEYDVIYNVDLGKGKGRVEMKNDTDKISSDIYTRDQCKYADIILRLNGDENPDLKEFDIPKKKFTPAIKKPINKPPKGHGKK